MKPLGAEPSPLDTVVLIPARDEGPRVGATVRRARAALPLAQVVVIDGRSQDDTALQAARAGATVVRHEAWGYAGTLLAGYRYLMERPPARVVQLDADGQHPPEAAPLLLDRLQGPHHLVLASRHGTPSGGGLPRRAGNHVLSGLVRALTGWELHDVTSGFWAFDRHALALLVRHLHGDCADANVRVLAVRLGLHPVEVPVTMALREGGRSMHAGLRGVASFATSVHRAVDAARLDGPTPDEDLP